MCLYCCYITTITINLKFKSSQTLDAIIRIKISDWPTLSAYLSYPQLSCYRASANHHTELCYWWWHDDNFSIKLPWSIRFSLSRAPFFVLLLIFQWCAYIGKPHSGWVFYYLDDRVYLFSKCQGLYLLFNFLHPCQVRTIEAWRMFSFVFKTWLLTNRMYTHNIKHISRRPNIAWFIQIANNSW